MRFEFCMPNGYRTADLMNLSRVYETTEKGTAFYQYSAFVEAVCCSNIYFLFLDKRNALILPVQAMTQGSPAVFDGCWLQMGGKPVRHIS